MYQQKTGEILNQIASIYRMREDYIVPPKLYHGVNVKKCSLQNEEGNNSQFWATRSENYDKDTIRIIADLVDTAQHRLSH